MFSNKGDFSDLKNIILIIFVAVILLLIINPVIKGGSRGSDIASCKNWAVLQSAIKDPALGIKLKDLKNPCTTFQEELKGKEHDVYETLAKGMHDTWKMYGQGKIDFFSDWDWGKKNTYCFVGDEIKIDEDRTINIGKFEEYLSNTNVPKSEITYTEFFTGTENTKLKIISKENDKILVKKNDKIYVLFTLKKISSDEKTSGKIKDVVFLGVGCKGGAVIGAGVGTIFGLGIASVPGSVVGGVAGCGIGILGAATVRVIGTTDVIYPGILLIPGQDLSLLEKECDGGIHYKPK